MWHIQHRSLLASAYRKTESTRTLFLIYLPAAGTSTHHNHSDRFLSELARRRRAESRVPANVRRAAPGRRSFLSIREILPWKSQQKLPKRVVVVVRTNLFCLVFLEASALFVSVSCVKCRRRILFQHPGAVPSASDVARAPALTRLARVR